MFSDPGVEKENSGKKSRVRQTEYLILVIPTNLQMPEDRQSQPLHRLCKKKSPPVLTLPLCQSIAIIIRCTVEYVLVSLGVEAKPNKTA
jgi:hypothetical protein